jgi:hypothetical protein
VDYKEVLEASKIPAEWSIQITECAVIYMDFHTTFSSSVILSIKFPVHKIHTETEDILKQKDTLTCSETVKKL